MSINFHEPIQKQKKIPESFTNIFTDIKSTDDTQTHHNDYNYLNKAATKRNLESFPFKCMVSTWNSLDIDIKVTADVSVQTPY